MRRFFYKWTTTIGILFALASATQIWCAQQSPSDTVPVSTVVSVEARRGKGDSPRSATRKMFEFSKAKRVFK